MQLYEYPQPLQFGQSWTAYDHHSSLPKKHITVKRVDPIDIVFHKIAYTVMVKDEKSKACQRLPRIKKEILKGVTGIISHGKVTAIMAHMGFNSPQFRNPPDYFMYILHQESLTTLNTSKPMIDCQHPRQTSQSGYLSLALGKRILQTSLWRELWTLMWQDAINIKRNPLLLTSRIIQTITLALVTGALFWKLSDDYSPSGLSKSFNSKNRALFQLALSVCVSAMSPVILTFPLEKTVILKEQSNRMYSVVAFFISRNLVELPLLIICPLLNSLIVYWMIDLHPGASYFFLFLLITFLCSLAGNLLSLFMSSFFTDVKVASGTLPTMVMPIMLVSGFFKNRHDLAPWVGWIEYISPIKYAFASYATNEYRGTTAPIELLSFGVNLVISILLLAVISVVSRILALIVLSLLKARLQ